MWIKLMVTDYPQRQQQQGFALREDGQQDLHIL